MVAFMGLCHQLKALPQISALCKFYTRNEKYLDNAMSLQCKQQQFWQFTRYRMFCRTFWLAWPHGFSHSLT
jgi:hypothetical protein